MQNAETSSFSVLFICKYVTRVAYITGAPIKLHCISTKTLKLVQQ